MYQINKHNYKNKINEIDRIDIDAELLEYFNLEESEGYPESALYIFNKYYDIEGIPKDFYLEHFYWISTAVRDFQLKADSII